MVHSPQWIDHEIGIRTADYDGGFFGYFLHYQGLAKKTLDLCVSVVVASEVLSRRNGLETNKMIIINFKFLFFRGRIGGFHESQITDTVHEFGEVL